MSNWSPVTVDEWIMSDQTDEIDRSPGSDSPLSSVTMPLDHGRSEQHRHFNQPVTNDISRIRNGERNDELDRQPRHRFRKEDKDRDFPCCSTELHRRYLCNCPTAIADYQRAHSARKTAIFYLNRLRTIHRLPTVQNPRRFALGSDDEEEELYFPNLINADTVPLVTISSSSNDDDDEYDHDHDYDAEDTVDLNSATTASPSPNSSHHSDGQSFGNRTSSTEWEDLDEELMAPVWAATNRRTRHRGSASSSDTDAPYGEEQPDDPVAAQSRNTTPDRPSPTQSEEDDNNRACTEAGEEWDALWDIACPRVTTTTNTSRQPEDWRLVARRLATPLTDNAPGTGSNSNSGSSSSSSNRRRMPTEWRSGTDDNSNNISEASATAFDFWQTREAFRLNGTNAITTELRDRVEWMRFATASRLANHFRQLRATLLIDSPTAAATTAPAGSPPTATNCSKSSCDRYSPSGTTAAEREALRAELGAYLDLRYRCKAHGFANTGAALANASSNRPGPTHTKGHSGTAVTHTRHLPPTGNTDLTVLYFTTRNRDDNEPDDREQQQQQQQQQRTEHTETDANTAAAEAAGAGAGAEAATDDDTDDPNRRDDSNDEGSTDRRFHWHNNTPLTISNVLRSTALDMLEQSGDVYYRSINTTTDTGENLPQPADTNHSIINSLTSPPSAAHVRAMPPCLLAQRTGPQNCIQQRRAQRAQSAAPYPDANARLIARNSLDNPEPNRSDADQPQTLHFSGSPLQLAIDFAHSAATVAMEAIRSRRQPGFLSFANGPPRQMTLEERLTHRMELAGRLRNRQEDDCPVRTLPEATDSITSQAERLAATRTALMNDNDRENPATEAPAALEMLQAQRAINAHNRLYQQQQQQEERSREEREGLTTDNDDDRNRKSLKEKDDDPNRTR
jgi:hypothetical protein